MVTTVISKTPPSDVAIIETQGLSIRFGRQIVLHQITLSIPRGQTVAIIGESGCGKTMLLKSLVGLLPATEGTVRFDGCDLKSLSEAELTKLRRRFGFVFQNAALFDSMSIQQNISFPLDQHGVPPGATAQTLIEQRLMEVGLPTSVLTKRPSQLSGGMRKRVGLARALILQPELLLYDEPTSELDPQMAVVIGAEICNLNRRTGVTSIVVSHDRDMAFGIADRIAVMHEGQIRAMGTPAEVRGSRDPLIAEFLSASFTHIRKTNTL
jgi:phospholipid/cholesterol/gamma-HCH transport system ATP-binding protein